MRCKIYLHSDTVIRGFGVVYTSLVINCEDLPHFNNANYSCACQCSSVHENALILPCSAFPLHAKYDQVVTPPNDKSPSCIAQPLACHKAFRVRWSAWRLIPLLSLSPHFTQNSELWRTMRKQSCWEKRVKWKVRRRYRLLSLANFS